MYRTDKFWLLSSIICSVLSNGWVFVYELSGFRFQSHCTNLNFRYPPCLEHRVIWHFRNIECGFTVKRIRDMIGTYSQMHRNYKYSQLSSIIWSVWQNGWVFFYQLGGGGFQSNCTHLNFRYPACFEHKVPWHSRRVWIHSETDIWHDKNIQSNGPYS